MNKFYDIEVTVCPVLLDKQKQTLFKLMDENEKIEWTDEMREHMDGLLNLLDYLQDQVMFRDED